MNLLQVTAMNFDTYPREHEGFRHIESSNKKRKHASFLRN